METAERMYRMYRNASPVKYEDSMNSRLLLAVIIFSSDMLGLICLQ